MHVGVFPFFALGLLTALRLPHARGGVSYWYGSHVPAIESSPCTWGCFLVTEFVENRKGVFPMHVGVFP